MFSSCGPGNPEAYKKLNVLKLDDILTLCYPIPSDGVQGGTLWKPCCTSVLPPQRGSAVPTRFREVDGNGGTIS